MRGDPVDEDLEWLKGRIEEVRSLFSISETRPAEPQPVYEQDAGRIEINIWSGDGVMSTIRGYIRDLSLDRDFHDATVFGDRQKTYLVGHQTFTVRGEVRPWKERPR